MVSEKKVKEMPLQKGKENRVDKVGDKARRVLVGKTAFAMVAQDSSTRRKTGYAICRVVQGIVRHVHANNSSSRETHIPCG